MYRMHLRLALRSLGRAPTFSTVALLTISASVAATALVLALLAQLLWRPLGIRDPASLHVILAKSGESCERCGDLLPRRMIDAWRDSPPPSVALVARHRMLQAVVRGSTRAQRLDVAAVDGRFFPAVGAELREGRLLGPADEPPEAPPVAVISTDLRRRLFPTVASAVGQDLWLNERHYTVVGVTSADYAYPRQAKLWIADSHATPSTSDDAPIYSAVVRLAAAGTSEALQRDLTVLARRAQGDARTDDAADPGAPRQPLSLASFPLEGALRDGLGTAPWLLSASLAVVMLVACLNLQHLFVVRATAGARVVALRQTVGATWAQAARPQLVESALLAVAGWGGGVFITLVALRPIEDWLTSRWQQPVQLALDPVVLLLSLGVALAIGGLACVASFTASRSRPLTSVLGEVATATTQGHRGRLIRRALVVSQIASALVLLGIALVLNTSLVHASRIDVGYDAANLIVVPLHLDGTHLEPWASVQQLGTDLVGSSLRLDEARAATAWTISSPSLAARPGDPWLHVEGRESPVRGFDRPMARYAVAPGFFDAIGVKLARGRAFTDRDNQGALPVAIVNEVAASRWWGAQNPIGRRIQLADSTGAEQWLTVVGVVRNTQPIDEGGLTMGSKLAGRFLPLVYTPLQQLSREPAGRPEWAPTLMFAVRTQRTPTSRMAARVGQLVEQHAPGVPDLVAQDFLSHQMSTYGFQRLSFAAQTLTFFAVVGLTIAMLGVYGVVADSTQQRAREIAVRRALGSPDSAIRWGVMRETVVLGAAGIACGGAGFFVLGTMISKIFVGITPGGQRGLLASGGLTDPLIVAGILAALVCVLAVATALPLRRALRISPMQALRS